MLKNNAAAVKKTLPAAAFFMIFIIISTVLISSMTSCRKNSAHGDADSYVFTDSKGYKVKIPAKPQKVAVLFSSFADIWNIAGGTAAITVGESVERGFASADAVLVDGGAGKAINTEALIAARPDFVICSADIKAQSDTAALMRSIGIPCAEFRVETFEEYISVLKICTEITGEKEAFIKYGTDIQEKISTLLKEIPTNESKTKILFIRSGSGASSAKAKTAQQHFAAAMLEEMNVYNIADNARILLDGLSIEEILQEDPEHIFISLMGDEKAAKAYISGVLETPAWQALTAVKTGNVHYLPKDLFQFKPNAFWYDAYVYLANILYNL